MAKQAVTNLHKTMTNMRENALVKNFQTKMGEISSQVKEALPTLLGHVDVASHLKLGLVKKKLLKKLNGKRKKFRLALESLGWGTLADLLDHAFNGEKLNVIV